MSSTTSDDIGRGLDLSRWARADRGRRMALPMAALTALAGPLVVMGALLVVVLYAFAHIPASAALQVDDCERAVMCCSALEGQGAEACRPVTELAAMTSGVPQSDETAQHETIEECRVALRRMSFVADSRGETLEECAVTDRGP